MPTKVNVVIPVYKPDDKLIQIAEMLKKQTIPVQKLILMVTCREVDGELSDSLGADEKIAAIQNMNGDGSFEQALQIELVKISADEFDHGNTRRIGADHVTSDCDFILYMTQDAIPENYELVEKLLEHFSDEKVAASYGRQLASDKSSLAEKFTRDFNYPDTDRVKTAEDIETIGIKAFFCSNVCAMYRLSVYKQLGGFVKKTIFNEDMIFANKILKSGYKIAYASQARVIHTHDYSGMQQYRRNFDLAVSQTLNPQAFEGISSESEGVKYVMAAFKYFTKNGKPWLVIPFGINCVYKLLGYRKGKRITSLTRKQVMKATSNQRFFNDITIDENIVKSVMNINGIEY